MGILFIDHKNVTLKGENGHIRLLQANRRTTHLPLSHLDAVVIHRRAMLDSHALGLMAERNIGVIIFNQRKPDRTAILAGHSHNQVARKIAHYKCSQDKDWQRQFSRILVARKILNQTTNLRHMLAQRPDKRQPMQRAILQLQQRLQSIQSQSRSTLRGIEGAAAAAYFQGFTAGFAPALDFTDRNRRPPRDPVNACLSLGYTLIHFEAVMAIHAVGLDPMLGFYHDPSFGRESLACDLIEPLRPSIDHWVWRLHADRELRKDHFSENKGACLLNKPGRAIFYRHYSQLRPMLRKRLKRYASLLQQAIVHASP